MAKLRKKWAAALVGAAALSLTLTACGGGGEDEGGTSEGGAIDTSIATGDIDYWLWDINQKPAYETCAANFENGNPNVNVKITQFGWTASGASSPTASSLATRPMCSPTTCRSSRSSSPNSSWCPWTTPWPRTASTSTSTNRVWPISGRARAASATACPRTSTPSRSYYNSKLTDDAGLTADQLGQLAWNPTDGGAYEKAIASLTVVKNGKRGDEAGFDKSKVAVYAWVLTAALAPAWVRRNGACTPARSATSNSPTRTPGAPTTTTTTPIPADRRLLLLPDRKGYMPSLAAITGSVRGTSTAPESTP